MKNIGWSLLVAALSIWQVGCQSGPPPAALASVSTPAELESAQARALASKRPLILLIAEPGQNRANDEAQAALTSRTSEDELGLAQAAILDLNVSRTRATAARFHPLETPLLVCLSPRGVIISRDQAPITESLILERMGKASEQAPELDAKLEELEAAADQNKNEVAAQFALADFLVKRQNAFEAVPILAAVAQGETIETGARIRAWVALGQAHLWIGEAEKARHEGQDLLAAFGAKHPEARAGANLLFGIQDANSKRPDLARQEFEAAISESPGSIYGKQAAEAMAKLPPRR